jgi:hypothetical protein
MSGIGIQELLILFVLGMMCLGAAVGTVAIVYFLVRSNRKK